MSLLSILKMLNMSFATAENICFLSPKNIELSRALRIQSVGILFLTIFYFNLILNEKVACWFLCKVNLFFPKLYD